MSKVRDHTMSFRDKCVIYKESRIGQITFNYWYYATGSNVLNCNPFIYLFIFKKNFSSGRGKLGNERAELEYYGYNQFVFASFKINWNYFFKKPC